VITGSKTENFSAKKASLPKKKPIAPVEAVNEEIPKISLIDQLCSYYGTNDLLRIFVEEVRNHHYESALEVFSKLTPEDASTSKAIIHKIRVCRDLQRKSELQKLLLNEEINDAEFYLEKARYFLDNGNTHESLKFLGLASKAPATYIEGNVTRLERLYLTARCRSIEFDGMPSVELKNQALESWYELKAELQTSKDHHYYKEADLEMQRITQKMDSGKG